MSLNLVVVASRDVWELETTLRGLEWSNLAQVDKRILLVNNARGTNARPEVIQFAINYCATNNWNLHVYHGIPENHKTCGRGAALYEVFQQYPADEWLKLDDDVFPLTKNWVQSLVSHCRVAGSELGVPLCPVNGTSSHRVHEQLGIPWPYPQNKIIYSDVAGQHKIWQSMYGQIDQLLRWQERGLGYQWLLRDEERLVNPNVCYLSSQWIKRRSIVDWDLIGEDEMTFNMNRTGDQATFLLDEGSLFLHWGYTPVRHKLEPIKDEIWRLLVTHWQ